MEENKHKLAWSTDEEGSVHSDDLQEDDKMTKAMDDYQKINEKKERMRKHMQELYAALSGTGKSKKKKEKD